MKILSKQLRSASVFIILSGILSPAIADDYVDRTAAALGKSLTAKSIQYPRTNKGPIPYPYFYEDPDCDECGGYDPWGYDILVEELPYTVVSLKDRTLALTWTPSYGRGVPKKEPDGKFYVPGHIIYNDEKFTVIGTYLYAAANWEEGSTVVLPSTIKFIGEDKNQNNGVKFDISHCVNLEHVDQNDYFPITQALHLPSTVKTLHPLLFVKEVESYDGNGYNWIPTARPEVRLDAMTPPKFMLDLPYDKKNENYPWLLTQRMVGFPRVVSPSPLKVPDDAFYAYATADYWRMFDNLLMTHSGCSGMPNIEWGQWGAQFYLEDKYYEDAETAKYDFADKNICYSIIDSAKVEVRSNILYARNHPNEWTLLTIPAKVTHDGVTYDVVRVGDYSLAELVPHGFGSTYSRYAYKRLSFPSSIKEIGTHVAVGTKLNNTNELVIPASVEKICDEAFRASEHTSAVIPAGVKTIGYGIFRDSPISKITMKGKTPPADCHPGAFAFINNPTVTVYVPAGSSAAYKAVAPFKWMNVKESRATAKRSTTGKKTTRSRR